MSIVTASLQSRVIPALLLQGERFVKTKRFGDPRYVGDPINVLSIFNDLEVDEIVLLDIGAARTRRGIQSEYLTRLASECFVPMAYGGGVATVDQAEDLIRTGFEKIVFNTALLETPEVVNAVVESLGAQAVIGAVDVRLVDGAYRVFGRSGTVASDLSLGAWTDRAMAAGVGEVLVTSIDREGTRQGIDLDLIREVTSRVDVPVIAHGGAGTRAQLAEPIQLADASAVAAGSQFVMQGGRDSILINYPTGAELTALFQNDRAASGGHSGAREKVDPRYEIPGRDLSTTVMCERCVITSDVPGARLDEGPICYYCELHDQLDKQYPISEVSTAALHAFAERLKRAGRGKKYDCILGVSGGTDSSYLAHVLVGLGLRPLAVHFDNTWNSPTATSNIYAVLNKLGVDLETYVVDNTEYDDIYLSFLKAGVKDIEIPTDIGFMGVLYRVAAKHGIKHIVEGHSFRTEGVSPMGWTYMDGGYIKSVQSEFGSVPMKTYPNIDFWHFLKWSAFSGIERTRPLYWIDYNKEAAKQFLTDTFGWQWYGGHHMENRFTAFFHSYFLPKRWGINYRQIELSALVRSGQMDRESARDQFFAPRYADPELIALVKNRLHLDDARFDELMNLPQKTYRDYHTYKQRFEAFRPIFWVLYKMNRVPKSFYVKFCKR
jgi:imidazoleglycerol phosphate synthase cyclase subunit